MHTLKNCQNKENVSPVPTNMKKEKSARRKLSLAIFATNLIIQSLLAHPIMTISRPGDNQPNSRKPSPSSRLKTLTNNRQRGPVPEGTNGRPNPAQVSLSLWTAQSRSLSKHARSIQAEILQNRNLPLFTSITTNASCKKTAKFWTGQCPSMRVQNFQRNH